MPQTPGAIKYTDCGEPTAGWVISGVVNMPAPDSSFRIGIAPASCSAWNTCSDLIMGEIPRPFPTIKFVLSEGGIGWVPHALERADRTWGWHLHWACLDHIPPNEAFRRNICFIDEQICVEHFGIDWSASSACSGP